MRFDLVVFDWDGTLMDSAAAIAESIQAACADLGHPVPEASQARYVIGLGLSDAISHVVPGLDPAAYPQMVERYRTHFLARDRGTELFDGARDLLQDLQSAGTMLAVATGKSRRGLDRALAETGLRPMFDFTRSADEGLAKPHPDMLLAILDRLGVSAEKALMVGDTTHDLDMAHAAGVPAVALTHGAHERSALEARQPLALLDDLHGLRSWLLDRQ